MKNINFTHPHVKSEFNTNNAWGFGGGIGTSYKFEKHGGLELRVGKACYRHTSSQPFTVLWFQNARVIDLSGYRKKEIAVATKWIDAIMTGQYAETDEYPYVKQIEA